MDFHWEGFPLFEVQLYIYISSNGKNEYTNKTLLNNWLNMWMYP